MADVDVKTRGLRPVMETLRDAGFSSAQAYGSLELRAAAAYMTLSQNLDVMDDLNMAMRSEEHTSELQSLMRISYAVFCLKKKNNYTIYIQRSPRKIPSSTPNEH